YLFFIDDRTRYEGLDLWFRIEELFPVDEPATPETSNGKAALFGFPPCRRLAGLPGALAVLLPTLALLGGATPARAYAALGAVRAARQEITAVRQEVERADPYPGGGRWAERLRQVGSRLEASGRKGGYQWYFRATEGFAQLDRGEALKTLDRVDTRLALI